MNKLIPEIIAPDPGQTQSWCHLAPFGRFTYKKPGGEEGEQLLDLQALTALVTAFKAAGALILIDREHLSIIGDDTTAMGWIEDLDLRGTGTDPKDGLYALVTWTDTGLDNITNRRLRWLSPVWDIGPDSRPIALDSAGLTNRARFRKQLTPVVNKDDINPTRKDQAAMDWTKVLEALGLGPEATPEDAAAAIAAIQEQLTVANKAMEEAALTAEAQKVAADNADKIANKDDFVKAYVANKESTLAYLSWIKPAAPAAKETVINKEDAKKPPAAWGKQVLNKLDEYRAMPAGKEKDAFLALNKDELLRLENSL